MIPERRVILNTMDGHGSATTTLHRAPLADSDVNWTGYSGMAIPFVLPVAYSVARMFWINGSQLAGNADIGLYDEDGDAIWRAGSTVRSGASVIQFVAPPAPVELDPGRYFWGFACAGGSAAIRGWGPTTMTAIAAGLRVLASAVPLPADLSGGTLPSGVGSGRYPILGMTRLAAGEL